MPIPPPTIPRRSSRSAPRWSPKARRASDDFFKGLLTTALAEDEILTEVRVPVTAANAGAAYLKFPHPASRFAVVGVAAVVTVDGGKVA